MWSTLVVPRIISFVKCFIAIDRTNMVDSLSFLDCYNNWANIPVLQLHTTPIERHRSSIVKKKLKTSYVNLKKNTPKRQDTPSKKLHSHKSIVCIENSIENVVKHLTCFTEMIMPRCILGWWGWNVHVKHEYTSRRWLCRQLYCCDKGVAWNGWRHTVWKMQLVFFLHTVWCTGIYGGWLLTVGSCCGNWMFHTSWFSGRACWVQQR